MIQLRQHNSWTLWQDRFGFISDRFCKCSLIVGFPLVSRFNSVIKRSQSKDTGANRWVLYLKLTIKSRVHCCHENLNNNLLSDWVRLARLRSEVSPEIAGQHHDSRAPAGNPACDPAQAGTSIMVFSGQTWDLTWVLLWRCEMIKHNTLWKT